MSLARTYAIESIWIQLTYPNSVTENFRLKKPRGFEFKFRKEPRLADYRDAEQVWQRGNYFYQLIARYEYEWHEMDLRKLLVAEKIKLRFPPAFGQPQNYNSAEVLLANDEVIKNYFEGLAVGSESGEVVPSGAITLEFEGVDAFTEFEAMNLIGWRQGDVGDDDGEDDQGPPEIDFSDDTAYYIFRETDNNQLRKIQFSVDDGVLVEESYTFPINSEMSGINAALGEFSSVAVLRNGNVVVHGSTTGWTRLWLFDADCNLLDTEFIEIHGGAFHERTIKVAVDWDDSLYINIQRANDDPVMQKYDKDLNFIWESPALPNFAQTWNTAIFNVTKNHLVVVNRISSNPDSLRFYDKTDGSFVKAEPRTNYFSAHIGNYLDGRFLVLFNTDDNENITFIYDEDAEKLTTFNDIGALGSLSTRTLFKIIENDTVLVYAGNQRIKHFDTDFTLIHEYTSVTSNDNSNAGGRTTNPNIIVFHTQRSSTVTGSLRQVNLITQSIIQFSQTGATFDKPTGGFGFGMAVENWQVQAPDSETSRPVIYALSVYPKTGQSPHDVTIELTAVNRTNSIVQAELRLDGISFFEFQVPASGSVSEQLEHTFEDGGVYVFTLADQSQTVYVDEAPPPVPGNYAGFIEIQSAADSDYAGKAPAGNVDVVGVPNRQSDPCEGDGDKFNVIYENTHYCTILPETSKQIISDSVSGFISSQVPGLGSTSGGLSPQGEPRIRLFSETLGTDDNGKSVTFSVNVNLEGPVFNKFDAFLSGGEDPRAIDDPVDILIGGTLFATTEAITGDESAVSIATKIYNACIAVDTNDLSFELDGAKVNIYSQIEQELSVALNIRGAGFDYETGNIIEI